MKRLFESKRYLIHVIGLSLLFLGFELQSQELKDTIFDIHGLQNVAVTIDDSAYYSMAQVKGSNDSLEVYRFNWMHQIVGHQYIQIPGPSGDVLFTTPNSLVVQGQFLYFTVNKRFGQDSSWMYLLKLNKHDLSLVNNSILPLDSLKLALVSELGVDSRGNLRLAGACAITNPQSPTLAPQIAPFVMKVNGDLQPKWSVIRRDSSGLGSNGADPRLMKFDDEDGVIISGNRFYPGATNRLMSFAMHVDSSGGIKWFTENPHGAVRGVGMICTYRGAGEWFCLSQMYLLPDVDARFISGILDSNGIWTTYDTIGSVPNENDVNDIISVSGNRILAAGSSYYGTHFSRFYKLHPWRGDSIWSRDCQASTLATNPDDFTRVFEGPNGNYVLFGYFHAIGGFQPSRKMYLRVLVTDTSGCIGTNCFLGNSESNPVHGTVRISPNPVKDLMRIDASETDFKPYELQYTIHAANGSTIDQGVISEKIEKVNLSLVPSGIYVVRIWQHNVPRQSIRIIKN